MKRVNLTPSRYPCKYYLLLFCTALLHKASCSRTCQHPGALWPLDLIYFEAGTNEAKYPTRKWTWTATAFANDQIPMTND